MTDDRVSSSYFILFYPIFLSNSSVDEDVAPLETEQNMLIVSGELSSLLRLLMVPQDFLFFQNSSRQILYLYKWILCFWNESLCKCMHCELGAVKDAVKCYDPVHLRPENIPILFLFFGLFSYYFPVVPFKLSYFPIYFWCHGACHPKTIINGL